jgi:hypothetical protein
VQGLPAATEEQELYDQDAEVDAKEYEEDKRGLLTNEIERFDDRFGDGAEVERGEQEDSSEYQLTKEDDEERAEKGGNPLTSDVIDQLTSDVDREDDQLTSDVGRKDDQLVSDVDREDDQLTSDVDRGDDQLISDVDRGDDQLISDVDREADQLIFM